MQSKIIKYQPDELIKRADNYLEHLKFLAPQKTDPFLIPYRKGNKWGFCTEDKKIVIDCIYDKVEPFSEGLAKVYLNGSYCFIDKQGFVKLSLIKDVIPEPFIGGISKIRLFKFSERGLNLKENHISKHGKLISSCWYRQFDEYSEGLALVEDNNKYGYIDETGDVIIPITIEKVPFDRNLDSEFSISLHDFRYKPGGFKNGLATVNVNRDFGYINKNGDFEIPCRFKHAHNFSEGLAAISYGEKWGFINKQEDVVMQIKYDSVFTGFKNGIAQIYSEHKSGYIDKQGEFVVPCIYDYLGDFKEGLAPARYYGKPCYINMKGERIMMGYYEEMGGWSEGLAVVKCEKTCKCGYIDKEGRNIIPCKYDGAGSFLNGIARISNIITVYYREGEHRYGYINKQGVEYWED